MSDLTTRLVIDLQNDRLLRGLRASGVGVERFSSNVDRNMRRSDRSVSRFVSNATRELGTLNRLSGGAFSNLRGEIAALGSAWAGISILKDSAMLDKNLTRMAQTAGVARRNTAQMRKEFFAIQEFNGTPVEQSRRAMDKMLQFGLSMDESLTSTRAITNASAVGHADAATIAEALAISAQAFGFDLTHQGVATEALNKMLLAGDLGAAELEKISSILSKVGNNARSAGMTYEGTLGFVEQLSQIEPNPEKLSTLSESTLRIFTNGKYRQKVSEELGVDFYDKNGASRNPYDVFDDIAKIYSWQISDRQRDWMISDVFDITDNDTKRGMIELLTDGRLSDMREKRRKISKDSEGIISERLPDSIDNAVDQLSRLKGTMRETLDGLAMPINKAVSGAIQFAINPKKAGGMGLDGTDLLMGSAAGIGGLFLAVKAAKKLGSVGGLLGGVAMGEVLEQSMGVTPVYVVNMPSSMLPIPGLPRGPGTSRVNPAVQTLSNRGAIPRLPNPTPSALNSSTSNLGAIYQGLSRTPPWLSNLGKRLGVAGLFVGGGVAANDLYQNGYASFRGWPKDKEELATRISNGESLLLEIKSFFGSEDAKSKLRAKETIEQKKPVKSRLDININQQGRATVSNVSSPDMDMTISGGGTMLAP